MLFLDLLISISYVFLDRICSLCQLQNGFPLLLVEISIKNKIHLKVPEWKSIAVVQLKFKTKMKRRIIQAVVKVH